MFSQNFALKTLEIRTQCCLMSILSIKRLFIGRQEPLRLVSSMDLFYPKPHDQERTQNEFVDWLDRQFREAHSHARELLGVNQNRQKDQFHKNVFGKPYEVDDKVWVFSKHKAKSKKFFLLWEGPYIVLERTSEVNYKVSEPQRLDKWRILHYNLLKLFVEEEPETSECRATPFRSTNCK